MDSARFWLPPGVKWCVLNRGDPVYLTLAPWVALGLLILRAFVEDYVFGPVGKWLEIPDRSCSAPQTQPRLERAFSRTKRPSKDTEVEWSQYQVHRWFWRARNYQKPSLLAKFKETGWRFIAYKCLVLYGVWANVKESCTWDQSSCYAGYPSTPASSHVLLYWSCQVAFYSSLLVSQCKDIRRKDFYQMLVHHITTLALLSFGYTINMLSVSVLIALVHDVSDVPLELAKLFHYASCERLANCTFVMFTIVFVVTRLVLLPFWLIWSVAFDIPVQFGSFPALYLSTGCLLVLQVLHLYWFKLIVVMVWELLTQRQLQGDTRSDSEMSDCTFSTNDFHNNTLETKKSI